MLYEHGKVKLIQTKICEHLVMHTSLCIFIDAL